LTPTATASTPTPAPDSTSTVEELLKNRRKVRAYVQSFQEQAAFYLPARDLLAEPYRAKGRTPSDRTFRSALALLHNAEYQTALAVLEVLNHLPTEDAFLLDLYYTLGHPLPDCAAILGVEPRVAATRLRDVTQRVRRTVNLATGSARSLVKDS
jgi:DNA-directed RNA polymerase specialized sigma24 family protein